VEMGAGFDLSSAEEMRLVLNLGGDPSRLSFAGPGKRNEELKEAMAAHVGMLSVESISELVSIEEIARITKRRVSVTLRVNPRKGAQGFSIRMGGGPSPFGIDEERLGEVMSLIQRSNWLEVKGLHVFSGTQSLDAAAIVENVQNILRLAEHCHANYGVKFEVINIGGGLGVSYYQDEKRLDEVELISGINSAIDAYLKKDPLARFVLELGRYLIAPAGMYVATVTRKKESRGVTFLILDGGMNHYLAASGNLGQGFRKNFPVLHGTKTDQEGNHQKYHVAGPLCTPIDRMASDLQLPIMEEGDLLVFPLAGAYAYTASPLQFLSHPAPAEIAVRGNEVFKIRNRIDCWHQAGDNNIEPALKGNPDD
jgi:diaminopimelate decarboxylase